MVKMELNKFQIYWDIYFYLQETIKLRFDEEGISIPFPQTTLSLSQETAEVIKR